MTSKRIAVMKHLLAFAGIDQERLRLEWVSAAEGSKFADVITDFTNHIKTLGPCKLEVAA
jgi:F420-non-reducing hydrogenase iron-sulfur subunit